MTDIIISKLKDKGVIITPQRIAIIEFLELNNLHPSAEDIYNNIKKKYPTLSVATVYNTLDKLVEIGEVVKLTISNDNKSNYEYNLTPHHHFYCKKCRKIYDISLECKYTTANNIDGHEIQEIHGYFKGICINCLNKNI